MSHTPSVYRDKIKPASKPEFREWIIAGHIVWQREDPEVIAEIANVRHRNIETGNASSSLAYYIQVAYRLPWFGEKWKPYYRYEDIDIPGNEEVLASDDFEFRKSSIVGIRYDISHFAAIKAEYRNHKKADQTRVNGGFWQVSFTF